MTKVWAPPKPEEVKFTALGHVDNWFSNFEPFEKPMRYGKLVFKTPEAFFQAMKTLNEEQRAYIATLPPGKAKRWCSKKAGNIVLRDDWETMKVEVMEYALRLKFRPGTKWHTLLMATGDASIIEWNNWGDATWGVILGSNVGDNILGDLLVKIREEAKLGLVIYEPHKYPGN